MRTGSSATSWVTTAAWLDEVGTEDANGRAIWALGYGLRFAPREEWRAVCRRMLERALPHVAGMTHLRARAYAAIGLTHAYEALDREHAAIEATLRSIAQRTRRPPECDAAAKAGTGSRNG